MKEFVSINTAYRASFHWAYEEKSGLSEQSEKIAMIFFIATQLQN